MKQMKRDLSTSLKMVDMRTISFYIGLKMKRNREKRTLKIS